MLVAGAAGTVGAALGVLLPPPPPQAASVNVAAIASAVNDYLHSDEAPPMADDARAEIVRLAAENSTGSPALKDAFVRAGATPDDYTGLLGRLDGCVVRLEMTVHDQRIAVGRRFIGANDSAR